MLRFLVPLPRMLSHLLNNKDCFKLTLKLKYSTTCLSQFPRNRWNNALSKESSIKELEDDDLYSGKLCITVYS